MNRDLRLARKLLEVLVANADCDGVALSHFLGTHVGRHGTPTAEDLYHLKILESGGYITRRPATQDEPALYQMTWDGHDLLESLRATQDA